MKVGHVSIQNCLAGLAWAWKEEEEKGMNYEIDKKYVRPVSTVYLWAVAWRCRIRRFVKTSLQKTNIVDIYVGWYVFVILNLIGESRVSPPAPSHHHQCLLWGQAECEFFFCLPGENQALDERKNSDMSVCVCTGMQGGRKFQKPATPIEIPEKSILRKQLCLLIFLLTFR